MELIYSTNALGQVCHQNGTVLEQPALFFDASNDTLLRIGEFTKLEPIMMDTRARMLSVGLPVQGLMILCFDHLPPEKICYVLNRALLYTQSGFLKKLSQTLSMKNPEAWLDAEMNRIPLA